MKIEMRNAWVRVMSAIQTSESMESHVLEPLLDVFAHREKFISVLTKQAEDEKRHSELIKNFLWDKFNFIKTKASFSDRIFYSLLFPAFKLVIKKNGIYGLCALLFYEYFSVGLYCELRERARENSLLELEKLIGDILKDEGKHIKNISALVQIITQEKIIGKIQNMGIARLLSLISLDVNFGLFAVHNREIRQSLIALNIRPEIINMRRKNALASVKSLLCERSPVAYAARTT